MENGSLGSRPLVLVPLLGVLASGCLEVTELNRFDSTKSRTLPVEITESISEQMDRLAGGYRFLHEDPPADRTIGFGSEGVPTLRRLVRQESLPPDAIPVGGHVFFSPSLASRAADFAAYYFQPLSRWSSVPASQAEHLLGEAKLREDLRLGETDIGCWARAMLIGATIDDLGFHSKKIWAARNAAGLGPVGWGWHCANIVMIEQNDGSVSPAVLDPFFDADRPMSVADWLARLNQPRVPVLAREHWLYWDVPPKVDLNYWTESTIALPEVDHIDVSLSEWTRYSINYCMPGERCIEDASIPEKIQQARRDLAAL